MVKLEVGMRLRLKKPHPCGSEVWEVLKTGVDVRLRCCGCGRTVLLPREKVLRLLRSAEGPSYTS
ncbi:DUF951 domain-containing protein [Ammonifex thiophilus]|uniref:DUF951 domain-containing protein n=1 Tax=Ammonifex thiophilus TaxID=444093 RepID=A0A3D8P7G1_9THEO|nr:DUF951 domain-containing protein [Ammonifex thiophilus]RDV84588.1 DUF951 domain-containing protein [Ammonifex thiophilus]